MKISYIGHSGYVIEWKDCYMLFDYYEGELPKFDREKKLYIFVSHHHHDHYNPKIFELAKDLKRIEFIISDDVHVKEETDFQVREKISYVCAGQKYELYDQEDRALKIETLRSTDEGVAFLIEYQNRRIYYAGDLNLWLWMGETEEYNRNMSKRFYDEMEHLKGVKIDLAFAPLDPRQEEYYSLGMEALLETAKVEYLFPMHFWKKPEIIEQFRIEKSSCLKDTTMFQVAVPGQTWLIFENK